MKTLSAISHLPSAIPAEQRVLAACHEAAHAERDYVEKACLAGALLLEYRETLLAENPNDLGGVHRGPPSLRMGHILHEDEGSGWRKWLEKHSLPRTTVGRWMSAAERASRFALDLRTADVFPTTIDVEGIPMPLSQVLTMPDAELTAAALKYKQAWFGFMADKTLSEAARAVADGESPAHRITRAASGKTTGGSGDLDRKEFDLFAGRNLSECLHHIGASVDKKGGHWGALSAVGKQHSREHLRLFLRGLPDELVDYILSASKLEWSLRQKGNRPEPLALKAAVDKQFTTKALSAATARHQP